MSRAARDRLLHVLATIARGWLACASAGYWPPPMLAQREDPRECPACQQPFACPLEWRRGHDDDWRVTFRCGECGHCRTVALPGPDAARLKARLAGDAEAIAEEAARLDAERMVADVAALTAALRRDLIGPGDFSGPANRTLD